MSFANKKNTARTSAPPKIPPQSGGLGVQELDTILRSEMMKVEILIALKEGVKCQADLRIIEPSKKEGSFGSPVPTRNLRSHDS